MLSFLCLVIAVPADGDTFRCSTGLQVRVAGVEANERHGGCHVPVCPTMPHAQARRTLERLTYRQQIRCERVGRSWRRLVASCRLPDRRRLECALLDAGSVVRWDRYWREYRLPGC